MLIDANTRRIVSRLAGTDASSTWTLRLEIFGWPAARVPDERFNYALLDLGALVCRPRRPLCGGCPLRRRCRSSPALAWSNKSLVVATAAGDER